MPIEFASIGRLWWALLAIPIVLLFVLRVKLKRKPVATLLFWDQLFQEQPPRAWWQQLRNLIALALQLAFLALVVGALIDPLWSWQKQAARQVVYVVDNSASMSAQNDPESNTRLDEAKAVAHRMLGTLRQRDTAAIITAGGHPSVAMGMTGDVRILQQAIETVTPTDTPTHLSDAVTLARRLFTKQDGVEIVVLTDGASGDIEMLQENDSVSCYGFGSESTSNIAITAFQVRRSVVDATSYQVLVEVTNFGDEEVECRLELDLEGAIVDVIPMKLAPDTPYRKTLDHTSSDGGRLTASIDIEDALSVDNQAVAVLPQREPIPVLLVSPGSLFLQSVFESIPNVVLSQTAELPPKVSSNTITVIHKTEIETVPSGAVLVIEPRGDSDLWKEKGQLKQPIVMKQADSPLLSHIRLQNVVLGGAKSLDFTEEFVPLLQSPLEVSMYSQIKRDAGDVLILSTNLTDGDLPLRIAFPVMIKNAIEHFLGNKGELRPAIQTGAFTSIGERAPLDATDLADQPDSAEASDPDEQTQVQSLTPVESDQWALRNPAGRIDNVVRASDELNIGPLDHAGVWFVGPNAKLDKEAPDLSDAEVLPIAVNLSNPAESDLRTKAAIPAAPLSSGIWGGHSIWFYLALFAILGISLEWFLYQRRVIA